MAYSYCLWLMPSADQEKCIFNTIAKLAAVHHTPAFSPHVTLATASADDPAEDEAEKWHQQVSSQILNILLDASNGKLHLSSPTIGKTRHQCVFMEVFQDGGFEILSSLHKKALKTLNPEGKLKANTAVFYPHMSLLYGDLEEPQRSTIAQSITDAPREVDICRLELWRVIHGQPESEWVKLAFADIVGGGGLPGPAAGGEAAVELGREGPVGGRGHPEGMGDIEDCPWHVSAPAHWEMYEYRLAAEAADSDL